MSARKSDNRIVRDGTAGNATLNGANMTANDTNASVNSVNMVYATNSKVIPVGARFTVNTVNNTTVYIVTGRTPANSNGGNTTSINFTPAWGANTPTTNDVITFKPIALNIKIGEGNLTYTEHKDYKYMLDRGNLDAVRDADEKPVDIKTDFVYDFVSTGTSEDITPPDALKNIGGAAEWVSSSHDKCEPYSIDVEIIHVPPCGNEEIEVTLLPAFRYETLEFNLKDATIACTGKCNVEQATIARYTHETANQFYPSSDLFQPSSSQFIPGGPYTP